MNKVTPFLYGLKMGVLYAGVSIMLALVYYVTGLDGQVTMSGIINMVVSVILLVYITKSFRKAMGDYYDCIRFVRNIQDCDNIQARLPFELIIK